MATTTITRSDTVASVLSEALDMRIADLRRSNGRGMFDLVRAKPGKTTRCTSCGNQFGRSVKMVRGNYSTVVFFRTVHIEIVECPTCALDAVLSDKTGVATRMGERI